MQLGQRGFPPDGAIEDDLAGSAGLRRASPSSAPGTGRPSAKRLIADGDCDPHKTLGPDRARGTRLHYVPDSSGGGLRLREGRGTLAW